MSKMSKASFVFKGSIERLHFIIKSDFWMLLALFIGVELMHHYFLLVLGLTRQTQSMNFLAIMGTLTVSLTEFVTLTMLIPLRVMEGDRGAPKGNFIAFLKKHIGPLASESLRAIAVTLLWTMALILPGIFKYIRYFFVPYVVIADPAYERGERDALKYSDQLVKGSTWILFLVIIVLFGLDTTRSTTREALAPSADSPLSFLIAALAAALFFVIAIYTNILLFRYYQLRVKALSGGTPNGSHI